MWGVGVGFTLFRVQMGGIRPCWRRARPAEPGDDRFAIAAKFVKMELGETEPLSRPALQVRTEA